VSSHRWIISNAQLSERSADVQGGGDRLLLVTQPGARMTDCLWLNRLAGGMVLMRSSRRLADRIRLASTK